MVSFIPVLRVSKQTGRKLNTTTTTDRQIINRVESSNTSMLPLEVSDQSHPSQPSLSTGDVALAGPFSGGGSVFRYLPVEIDTKLGPTTIQNRTCDTTDDETLARGPFDTVPGLAFLTYWCQWMFPASSPTTSDNDDHNDSAIKGDETELQMPPSSTSSTAAATVPLEAYGLAVDAYARATIGMSSIFLGPALLQLAATAAGCPLADTDDNNDQDEGDVYEECTNTIHGFRPSSLLTNLAAVAGVVGCLAVPFIGSMVDHTAFRRELGAATAALLIVVKALELVISAHTWEFVAVLQIVSALLFTSHITASYAYISELSAVPNEQASYNTTFFIILYASTLIFMIQVLLVAALWEKFTNGSNNDTDHDITTARISQSITVLTCAPCFAYAWTHLFRPRPAKHAIPPHQTLLSAGYRQLFGTVRTLYHHNPALTRLLWAVSLSEAASGALIAVSTTYMKSVLRMNSNESECAASVVQCV